MATNAGDQLAETLVSRLRSNQVSSNKLHAERLSLVVELEGEFHANAHRWVLESTPSGEASFLQRAFVTEVAVALHLHEGRAYALVREARMIVRNMPSLFARLAEGDVSSYASNRIAEQASTLPDDVLGSFDAQVAAGRFDLPDSTIIARAKRVAERLRVEPIEVRQERASAHRGVCVEAGEDGMGNLILHAPLVQVRAVERKLLHAAVAAQAAGDTRTQQQLMADALVEAALHGDAMLDVPADTSDPHHTLRGIRANVTITVPALTLLGQSDEPATMDGVGPIPLDIAKVLAGNATSWNRVLTHPVTGVRLAFDRETYRVPSDLRRWLVDRDKTCRFPNCTRTAAQCDIDHLDAWEHGGKTNHDNLAHLCRKHHRLKHNTSWEPTHDGDAIEWRSPTGVIYRDPPEDPWADAA